MPQKLQKRKRWTNQQLKWAFIFVIVLVITIIEWKFRR